MKARERSSQLISTEHIVHIVMQIAVMLQQIGNGSVQIAAAQLRARHLLRVVDVRVVSQRAHEIDEELLRVVDEREDNVGSDQGTGVDERVARFAVLVLQLHKRVECCARRLLAYSLPQILA